MNAWKHTDGWNVSGTDLQDPGSVLGDWCLLCEQSVESVLRRQQHTLRRTSCFLLRGSEQEVTPCCVEMMIHGEFFSFLWKSGLFVMAKPKERKA